MRRIEDLDPDFDTLWAAEAEARIDAAERGEVEVVPAEEVFGNYDRH